MFSAGVAGAESAVPVAIDQLSNAAALAEGPCVGGGAYVDGVFLDEAALAERESELATLTAHLDAATHRQLTLIRIIDVSERWAKQGAKSCAHWLSWRVGIALGAAREKVRVARRLGGLEKIDDALRRGALSYSKVRAMTRVATPANEEKLLNIALETTAAQLEKICRGVRQQQREDGRKPDDPLDRYVRLRSRGDGTVAVEAVLLPDEAERVMEAIRSVRASMSEGLEVKPDQADALVRIADAVLAGDVTSNAEGAEPLRGDAGRAEQTAQNDAGQLRGDAGQAGESERNGAGPSLGNVDAAERSGKRPATRTGQVRTCGADRAQVVVHFTEDQIDGGHAALMDDGRRISAETFRRLACDCSLLGVVEDERGDVLDIGRKSRRIPPALRRAVMLRDRSCSFPGCTHDRYIDLHHVEHWLHGGETSKANLLALCSFHHRLVHEAGFTIELDAAGEPRFVAPDRAVLPSFVPPAKAPEDPLAAFEEAHADLAIDDETGLTRWDGEPVDAGACVEVLCADPPDFDLPVNVWLAKHGIEA